MLTKYKSLILYLVFGVFTTVVNFVVYNLVYYRLHIDNSVAVTVAWGASVLFAYVTNKIWVFENENKNFKSGFMEFIKFVTSRTTTGILDWLIMFLFVDIWYFTAWKTKLVSNIIVIVLNYVLSRFFVFVKVGKDGEN